jgi:hypothetical protein
MYPVPMEDPSQRQAKLIVNMVVVVFLIVGLLLVLQYFNFLYLRDLPVAGSWLMDMYERVFGVPKVLILHGDDSLGDWVTLRDKLSNNLIFYSEDIDANKYSAGLGTKLKQYGLVIVIDVQRLDKDKLLNLRDYVKAGGNLIWVGDAGTRGVVEYDNRIIANQTGWKRKIVCIDEITMSECVCDTYDDINSTCKFLPGAADQTEIDLTQYMGITFMKNVPVQDAELEIVDDAHWAVVGIKRSFTINNTNKITSVSNDYSTALVANVNIGEDAYPGIIINDNPGSEGAIIYFAYPPENTMEILEPIVERLRY